QEQLEAWSGTRAGTPAPPNANVYLFSSFGTPAYLELRLASRTALVSLASGFILLCGLLVIYVPAVRHPAVLLAAAIALGAWGVLAPEPAHLVGQAAGLGLVLVLVAGVLQHLTRPRRRPLSPIVARRGSSLIT